jgi:hypothetical protein
MYLPGFSGGPSELVCNRTPPKNSALVREHFRGLPVSKTIESAGNSRWMRTPFPALAERQWISDGNFRVLAE